MSEFDAQHAGGARLADRHGRRFEYLRLSLTDMCNFRCSYCLPDGFRKARGAPSNLSIDEIRRLVEAFAQLGLWKVRLTGGEPTLRREFLEIARTVTGIEGIRKVAVTTNGYRLAERAQSFADAGISAINVSMDSLQPQRFRAITGHDRLGQILEGIAACRAAGISSVKLNSVLLKGLNDDEVDDFLAFVGEHDLTLRFIEVMRTNDNPGYFAAHHLPGTFISERLETIGWLKQARQAAAGPAIEYTNPDGPGRIGIIAPYSRDFCTSCNRLRVSATGKLHLCLFGDAGIDLRPLLQQDSQKGELIARLQRLVTTKAPAHLLHQDNSGATPHLASIGG
ncbi:GTP 3',8-cyclase MoaA [Sphingorhabdus buctiana]|uniref:GTP 3',8-cyclase n=1 Tax=Sphingorhabdus buctiana TaxID=1508805 RepID=A0ABW4MD89_9SPHN